MADARSLVGQYLVFATLRPLQPPAEADIQEAFRVARSVQQSDLAPERAGSI